MPSLHEYIRTLRTYNPGITNRTVIIYLLKNGWRQEEVEAALKEIDAVSPVSNLISNVSASTVTIQSDQGAITVTPPGQIIGTKATGTAHMETEIEPQALELENGPSKTLSGTLNRTENISEPKKAIQYPTYERVQNQKQGASNQNLNQNIETLKNVQVETVKPVENTHPLDLQAIMDQTLEEREKNEIHTAPGVLVTPPTPPTPITPTTTSITSVAPATSPDPIMPYTPPASSEFGSPVSAERPRFTYEDVMEKKAPILQPQSSLTSSTPTPTPTQAPATAQVSSSINPVKGSFAANIPISGVGSGAGIAGGAGISSPGSASSSLNTNQNQSALNNQIAPNTQSVLKRAFKWILVLAILAGLFFGYIRYVHGVYIFAKAPFEKNEILSAFANNFDTLHSGAVVGTTTLSFLPIKETSSASTMSPVQNVSTSSLATSTLAAQERTQASPFSDLIPVDAKLTLETQGRFNSDPQNKGLKEVAFNQVTKFVSSGVEISSNLDFAIKDEIFYLRFKQLPAFSNNLKKYENTWISFPLKIELSDQTATTSSSTIDMVQPIVQQVQNLEGTEQIFTDLLKADVFTISEPITSRSGNYKVLFTYAISVNKEKLDAFLSSYQPQSLSEQASANMMIIATLLRVMDNTSSFITVDAKGMPYALRTDSVLDISRFGIPTVVRLESEFDIREHNKKQYIESPSEVTPFSEIGNILVSPTVSGSATTTTASTTSVSVSTTTKSTATSTVQNKNVKKAAPSAPTAPTKSTQPTAPTQTTIIKKDTTTSNP